MTEVAQLKVEHEPSHSCYSRGCRLSECREAHARYERDRKRERSRPDGRGLNVTLVDATEVRNHLLWLASKGVGIRQIEQVSGVSSAALKDIRRGKARRVHSSTANRVLGIHLGRVRQNRYGAHPHHQPHYKGAVNV